MRYRFLVLAVLVLLPLTPSGLAQTSSLGKKADQTTETANTGAESAAAGAKTATAAPAAVRGYQGNRLLERNSLFAVEVKPPKEFKQHDLITIIVRQQKKFEADSESENKKDYEIKSELEAFFKPIDGGLGATTFYRGKPNVDYKFGSKLKGEGDQKREDSFTTRLTGEIVDVKPNGNLVISANSRVGHDEEVAEVVLTGVCRGVDVTPDNTVLSTQLADLQVTVKNSGAIKDAATRGWLTRFLDTVKPF